MIKRAVTMPHARLLQYMLRTVVARARERWSIARGSTLLGALGILLLPKCPACIAAYLSALGVSAGAAAVLAPWLRPAALLLGVTAFGVLLAKALRRTRRAHVEGSPCCR